MEPIDKRLTNELVKAIDKEWPQIERQRFPQSEVTLVFSTSRGGTHIDFPKVIQVYPEPEKNEDLHSKPGRSQFELAPCSYLDCTGISINSRSVNDFVNLFFLQRYLQQVNHVKILLVVPYGSITNGSNVWMSSLFNCPAVHLLNTGVDALKRSFGLVVVMKDKAVKKNHAKACSPSPAPSAKLTNSYVNELKNTVRDQLNSLKEKLEKTSIDDIQNSGFIEHQLKFLNRVLETNRILVLQQDPKFGSTVNDLVTLPSPPGYKILKFCQNPKNCISFCRADLASEKIWEICSHLANIDGKMDTFVSLMNTLYHRYQSAVEELTKSIVNPILKWYTRELEASPKRENHAVTLGAIIERGIKAFRGDHQTYYYLTFSQIVTTFSIQVGCPLDYKLIEKLELREQQLKLLSKAVATDSDANGCDSSTLLQKIVTPFQNKLENLSQVVGQSLSEEVNDLKVALRRKFLAIQDVLIILYDKFIKQNLLSEYQKRMRLIEKLSHDEKLLENCNKNNNSWLELYSQLCQGIGYPLSKLFLEDLEELDKQISGLENMLRARDQITERVQANPGESNNDKTMMREHLNKLKITVATYNGLLSKVQNSVSSLCDNIMDIYHERILSKISSTDSIDLIVSNVTNVTESLTASNRVSTIRNHHRSISDELNHVSLLILEETLPLQETAKLLELEEQMKVFLGDLDLDGEIKWITRECLHKITGLVTKFDNLSKYLRLLVTLKQELITFHFHRVRKCATVDNDETLYEYLRLAMRSGTTENDIVSFKCNASKQLKLLMRKMIDHAIHHKIEFVYEKVENSSSSLSSHSHAVLKVSGNFVKFSDFVEREEISRADLKEIRIFASETVFIDLDLYTMKGQELAVTVIAPQIKVIGNRLITLDGVSGENYPYPAAVGRTLGSRGADGHPGRPGGNAGNLFVLCAELQFNNRKLLVTARGGNGGNGQNGGDGGLGESGRDALESELGDADSWPGQPGKSGGDGGDGGAGGFPGGGGDVKIIPLSNYGASAADVQISICRISGQYGEGGLGGRGGNGGKTGNGLKRKLFMWWKNGTAVLECQDQAGKGNRGRNGGNSTGITMPKPTSELATIWKILSDYRMFVLKSGSNHVAVKFLEKIDTNPATRQYISSKSLALDFLNLEKTDFTFGGDTFSLERKHEYFQRRLINFNKTENDTVPNAAAKNCIHLLYAASVSKTLLLREHSQCSSSCVVVNLRGYFDVITATIKRLKSSHLHLSKCEALDKYEEYLNAKMSEVQTFISQSALPAIAIAEEEMSELLEECLDQVNSFHGLVEEDLNKRKNEEAVIFKKFQRMTIAKHTVALIGGACRIAGLMGFMVPGLITGLTLAASSVIQRQLNSLSTPTQREIVSLPACLDNPELFQDLHSEWKRKCRSMWSQIEMIAKFLDGHNLPNKNLNGLLRKWEDNVSKFEKAINAPNFSLYVVMDHLDTFEGLSYRNDAILELQRLCDKIASESTSQEIVHDLEFLLMRLHLINCDPILSAKLTRDEMAREKLKLDGRNEISDLIRKSEQQLANISKRKESIYQSLIPLVKEIIGGVSNGQHQQNRSQLIMLKKMNNWKTVHEILRDLKDKLGGYLKGLECEVKVIKCVGKMEQAILLISDLYTTLEKYEESKKLAEVMAALTSQQVNITSIEDRELKVTLGKLDFHLRANLFLLDYTQAVNAFKQWVFPFANRYFPSPLQQVNSVAVLANDSTTESIQDNLQKLTSDYIAKFEDLRSHLGRYKSMTIDSDSVLFKGTFSSRNFSSVVCPPFYLWRWDQFGDPIGRLLQGEEVALCADVWKAASEMDGGRRAAIKFKSIQLYLKHKDGVVSEGQRELDQILNEMYMVTMVHSGVSYYRLFSQYFVIRGSAKQEFSYSYDLSTRNVTYDKNVSDGDYCHSPYTNWVFKLTNMRKNATELRICGNQPLAKFAGKVDLELHGEGLYLDEGAAKEKKLDESYLKNLHAHYEQIEFQIIE